MAFSVLLRPGYGCSESVVGRHPLSRYRRIFWRRWIIDVTDELSVRGWELEGRHVFIADHYRAAGDMIIKWALSDSTCCNVEIADWFPTHADRQRLFALLSLGKQKLLELGRLQRLEAWLASQ